MFFSNKREDFCNKLDIECCI